MTRNDARKIIKTHTQTRYSNSVLLLLLRLVDLTYRKDKDNAEREIETTTASLLRAAGIKDRQLAYILDQLSDDGVLLDVERNQKHVTCRLNLEPLLKLDAYGETQKAEKKARDADRAAKAREAREDQRTEQNVRTLYAKGLAEIRQERQPLTTALVQRLAEGPALTPEQQTKLDAYLAAQGKADEYGLKLELLKDVKDPNIRCTMLTWDVERIRRAKANAEALMCNTPEAIAEP